MLGLLILLLSPLPDALGAEAGPWRLAADRLEAVDETWRAEGRFRLSGPGLTLAAELATSTPTAACPDGALTLEGAPHLTTSNLTASAHSVSACLADGAVVALTLSQARVDTPQISLFADEAALGPRCAELYGAWATPCRCAAPTWHIETAHAALTAEDLTLSWPVLKVGELPVATWPSVTAPLSPRRTGLLLPSGGFAEGEPFGRLPLFVTLGQSADLTLAPGYRAGPALDATARVALEDRSRLTLSAHAQEGLGLQGHGTGPLGPLRLALDGSLASNRALARRQAPSLALASQAHERGELSLSLLGQTLGVGARLGALAWRAAPELSEAAVLSAWSHARLSAPEGTLTTSLSYDHLPSADLHRLDLVVQASRQDDLGPVRLRPLLELRTLTRAQATSVQGLAGTAALEARVAVGRAFGRLWHEIALQADGAVVEAKALPDEWVETLDDQLQSHRQGGLTLSSTLRQGELSATVSVREGLRADLAPIPEASAILSTGWASLSGWASERGVVAWTSIGDADGFAELAGVWLEALLDEPWQRVAQSPALLMPLGPLGTQSLSGRLGGALGPLHLEAGAAVALDGALLGEQGALRWTDDCGCLGVSASVWHVRGRETPELWLSLDLGTP